MKVLLSLIIGSTSFSAYAIQFGHPDVKSVSVQHEKAEEIDIDMGTTHVDGIFFDTAIIRIDKKRGQFASAKLLYDNLAYCQIEDIQQSVDGELADLVVNFEVENDGGFNSCTLSLHNGERTVLLTLGAEVGD